MGLYRGENVVALLYGQIHELRRRMNADARGGGEGLRTIFRIEREVHTTFLVRYVGVYLIFKSRRKLK